MAFAKKIWKDAKIKPDIWFFFGFLFTFTLSIRKVILYFPIQGTFNEYTGTYVYVSDILLILTLIFWIIPILKYNYSILSSNKLWITCLSPTLSTAFKAICMKSTLYLPLIIVIWSFISISWSSNPPLAIFKSIKLLELYFLYIYIIFRFIPDMCKNVPRGTIHSFKNFDAFFIILIALGTIQSIIGIAQVILQHSIGLSVLRESLISPNIPGVAKLVIHENKYIRAYGLFPHPNILGGFLIMSITATWLYIKLHRIYLSAKKSTSLDGEKCSTPACRRGRWNNITLQATQTISSLFANRANGTILLYIILAIQLLALLLSFSKSAIIGLALAMLYINVPRGTFSYKNFALLPRKSMPTSLPGKKIKTFANWSVSKIRLIILILSITLISLFLARKDLEANLNQSIKERLTYLNVSRGTILTSPIIGIGSGQYIWNMQIYKGQTLETWQFQPVHNVFLLIWSELGIVGLVLFAYFMFKMFHARLPARQVEHFKQLTTTLNKSRAGEGINISSEKPECLSIGKLEGDSTILCNEYTYLSNDTLLAYFKGILLSFIFIMLFDHYFWDIWQGQVMLWMALGVIAGMRRS